MTCLPACLNRPHRNSTPPHSHIHRTAGFALVKFENADVAGMAIAGLNGYQLDGRPIQVRFDRQADGPGGAGGGGGGGGMDGGMGGGEPGAWCWCIVCVGWWRVVVMDGSYY